eukprot:scaffold67571_cov63-Phaeocystis_antarctica.AAC.4
MAPMAMRFRCGSTKAGARGDCASSPHASRKVEARACADCSVPGRLVGRVRSASACRSGAEVSAGPFGEGRVAWG